eukprot:SM013404S27050  [mRNA]  locus=s13404:69:305:- [translate_table: standard]
MPARLPLPVVSVGNVTWGGSGKTPMAEHLARRSAALGMPPLVLTRVRGPAGIVRLRVRNQGWGLGFKVSRVALGGVAF